MKNSLKFLILILASYSLNITAISAQQYMPDDDQATSTSKNLVLKVYINSKNYDVITNTLNNMNGLRLVAYCEEAQLLLINYNPQIIPKPDQIGNVITQLDPNYTTKIIYNTKFDDVIKNCKPYSPPVLLEIE